MHQLEEQVTVSANRTFGLRKMAPRVCVADRPHLQKFFCETLEEIGFVTCKVERHADIPSLLSDFQPDLLVLGLSGNGVEAAQLVEALAAEAFAGRVLLVGPPASLMTKAVQELARDLGLNLLPILATPFSDEGLRAILSEFIPREDAKPVVDAAEALHSGWLELWYQPKVEVRSLSMCGAEALVRLRHPTWGLVQPASFLPDEQDAHFVALSEHIIAQAAQDWRYFFDEYGHVELAINLPVRFFEDPSAASRLVSCMPKHPAFQGAIVEMNAADVIRNIRAAAKIAGQLRFQNIAVSLDDLGTEWPSLLALDAFPFTEIKVDAKFVAGCAEDRLKQVVCRRILEFADGMGVRTVAEGVENRADFIAARELGFDVVQGYFMAKPMESRKFVRRVLREPLRFEKRDC